MRLWGLLACVLVATVGVLGCGSGGSSSGSSGGTSAETTTAGTESNSSGGESADAGQEGGSQSGPLTKKAFIKEAEAVCQKVPTTYEQKSEALAKSMTKGQKPTAEETKLKAGVPTDLLAIEELEALTPPKGDEQKVEAIIQSLKNAAKGLEENPKSEFTGPLSPFAEWQTLTKEYGLNSCSEL